MKRGLKPLTERRSKTRQQARSEHRTAREVAVNNLQMRAVVQATTLSLSHAFDEIDQTGEWTSVFHDESMNVLCRRYLALRHERNTLETTLAAAYEHDAANRGLV